MNHQQLVDKLAQSSFMRSIARFVVHKAIRVKSLTEDMKSEQLEKTLKNITEKLKDTKNKFESKQ